MLSSVGSAAEFAGDGGANVASEEASRAFDVGRGGVVVVAETFAPARSPAPGETYTNGGCELSSSGNGGRSASPSIDGNETRVRLCEDCDAGDGGDAAGAKSPDDEGGANDDGAGGSGAAASAKEDAGGAVVVGGATGRLALGVCEASSFGVGGG